MPVPRTRPWMRGDPPTCTRPTGRKLQASARAARPRCRRPSGSCLFRACARRPFPSLRVGRLDTTDHPDRRRGWPPRGRRWRRGARAGSRSGEHRSCTSRPCCDRDGCKERRRGTPACRPYIRCTRRDRNRRSRRRAGRALSPGRSPHKEGSRSGCTAGQKTYAGHRGRSPSRRTSPRSGTSPVGPRARTCTPGNRRGSRCIGFGR